MPGCFICNKNVSSDSENICVGLLKKEYVPICPNCASILDFIEKSEDAEAVKSRLLLLKNSTLDNKKADKYIAKKIKSAKKKINRKKKEKTMYAFKGIPCRVPKICTNCLKPTDNTETIINLETEISRRFSKVRTTYKIQKFKFGLCVDCAKNRKGLSAIPFEGGYLYGFLFRNKNYAEIIGSLNNQQTYSIKCDEKVDHKFNQYFKWIEYYFVSFKFALLWLFWIVVILIILCNIL